MLSRPGLGAPRLLRGPHIGTWMAPINQYGNLIAGLSYGEHFGGVSVQGGGTDDAGCSGQRGLCWMWNVGVQQNPGRHRGELEVVRGRKAAPTCVPCRPSRLQSMCGPRDVSDARYIQRDRLDRTGQVWPMPCPCPLHVHVHVHSMSMSMSTPMSMPVRYWPACTSRHSTDCLCYTPPRRLSCSVKAETALADQLYCTQAQSSGWWSKEDGADH
ncbi:uncharacterized protein K460DRAFT_128616 [Cucurbitaria berberidis CBS 394.84]|uniref:Uncharacterized protein n=1 Tax=Cucurbitaria berberidis CBS 394.84 TaxID=1168544 RepID=A0A9P4L917_9PLEO|nr:uncharacterized protein K460DRAFT_128616 [Cucurbitaria berberidis CBS 394.84]KAF1846696.1 hypothetical protein K460DRAFT_128616 [Cucurbitaria berberidis CBS 394.84]